MEALRSSFLTVNAAKICVSIPFWAFIAYKKGCKSIPRQIVARCQPFDPGRLPRSRRRVRS
jgi:hypothetical protein